MVIIVCAPPLKIHNILCDYFNSSDALHDRWPVCWCSKYGDLCCCFNIRIIWSLQITFIAAIRNCLSFLRIVLHLILLSVFIVFISTCVQLPITDVSNLQSNVGRAARMLWIKSHESELKKKSSCKSILGSSHFRCEIFS